MAKIIHNIIESTINASDKATKLLPILYRWKLLHNKYNTVVTRMGKFKEIFLLVVNCQRAQRCYYTACLVMIDCKELVKGKENNQSFENHTLS